MLHIYKYLFAGDIHAVIVTVSELIGTDWSRLVSRLDPKIDTDAIQAQNQNNLFKQAKAGLKQWANNHTADATVANLIRNLKAIGRNDVVLAIEKEHQ